MARAYYNDTNKAAVAVMRELIADGVIAPGDVDDRSIEDVQPDDLAGYTQVHLFAGGGLWSVAARIAGWPDERPIWTGSCPCQPFSVAGKGAGKDDPRHLWPHFLRLIRGARTAGFGPPVIMGEQVSGKAGYGWFDGVRADLEAEGYACRARDIPALAVDAPHERNRLYWLAVGDADAAWEFQRQGHVANFRRRALHADARDMDDAERDGQREPVDEICAGRLSAAHADGSVADCDGRTAPSGNGGKVQGRSVTEWSPLQLERRNDRRGGMVHSPRLGRGEGRTEHGVLSGRPAASGADALGVDLVDTDDQRREELRGAVSVRAEQPRPERAIGRNGSFWSDAEWIICHDGKARRAKSGLPLLVDGFPGRVDLWSLAGNAISPVLAAEVIGAFLDAERDAA